MCLGNLDLGFLFQSTPSVWRETVASVGLSTEKIISIHSLRVEGDSRRMESADRSTSISIHSLRVEGDGSDSDMLALLLYFNPLPPCGGRLKLNYGWVLHLDFNPLPPCGGRPTHHLPSTYRSRFQSTPSVWRETSPPSSPPPQNKNFNPLPPCGGRLQRAQPSAPRCAISIHSLRVEGDAYQSKDWNC